MIKTDILVSDPARWYLDLLRVNSIPDSLIPAPSEKPTVDVALDAEESKKVITSMEELIKIKKWLRKF